jgi:mono/diheme cytochrome c family protein
MTPLHRIEERLHALTVRQAIGWVVGANLFLVGLAFALPADGEMRGPALLSVLGNFHILALHIPAAVLLVVPLFEFFERHEQATATVRRLSVFSAAGTWGAVFCGILHAHYNGFAGDSIQLHLWGGIAASAFAGIASLLLAQGFRVRLVGQVIAIGVMGFAAHVGGELVHEEGFPFKPNKVASPKKEETPRVVTTSQKRDDYTQVIRPILEAHCVECHGAKKVKGKLRMDTLEALKKGGSEGSAYVAGDLKKSLMHVRVTLDPEDDEFMPTEGTPLTKEQVNALALWIEAKPIPDEVAKLALAATKAPKQAPKK